MKEIIIFSCIVFLVLLFVYIEKIVNKKVEQKKLKEKNLRKILIKEKEAKQNFLYKRKFVLVRKNNQLWQKVIKEKEVILYNEKQKKCFVCSVISYKGTEDLEITFEFKYDIE